ncbi:hypothetical protein LXL04_013746 [Taraxacum kok-saghyz]
MATASIQITCMSQAIQEQKAIFEIGDEVEVTARANDFGVYFYAGVVTKIESEKAHDKYYGLKKEDGKVRLEKIDFKNLRPKPIDFRFKFK